MEERTSAMNPGTKSKTASKWKNLRLALRDSMGGYRLVGVDDVSIGWEGMVGNASLFLVRGMGGETFAVLVSPVGESGRSFTCTTTSPILSAAWGKGFRVGGVGVAWS